MTHRLLQHALLPALSALLLAACEGELQIRLTDAPIDDATAVNVRFTGVELLTEAGTAETYDFDEVRTINLLDLQGGRTVTLVSDDDVPGGTYNGIRLLIDAPSSGSESTITFSDGSEFPLVLSSAAGGSRSVSGSFTVEEDERLALTIDFDLRRSILEPTGTATAYRLAPRLRLVNDADIGTLTGRVASAYITDPDCDNGDDNSTGNTVYVFSGRNATVSDMDNAVDDAITFGAVTLDDSSGEYGYTVGFLPAGNYTVALTCQGRLDDPVTQETIAFTGTTNVSIESGRTRTLDFD